MNNYVLVRIKGKNIRHYLKWLLKQKINIIKLINVNYDELNLLIDYKDYHKLTKYSKTYQVSIIQKYGRLKLYDIIKNNLIIISCLVLAVIFLYCLSNIIFKVDIMYNDQEIITLIEKELAKYKIAKYHWKKEYPYLIKVKEKILKDNNDVLEWIEIEESGTKYIVRLVERKKQISSNQIPYQSIVAKKDAIIESIIAYSGEKKKEAHEYVKKDDVIISGILTKPDETNIYVHANGIVTGEVWYKAIVEYPLYYQEEKLTGKNKLVLSLYFLNREILLFPYKKYKHFQRQSNLVLENNFIPIKVSKDRLYEAIVKDDIYTVEEATVKAINEVKQKLLTQNKQIIKIKDTTILNQENLNSKIKLTLFVSAIEDITEIIELTPEPNQPLVEN